MRWVSESVRPGVNKYARDAGIARQDVKEEGNQALAPQLYANLPSFSDPSVYLPELPYSALTWNKNVPNLPAQKTVIPDMISCLGWNDISPGKGTLDPSRKRARRLGK